VTESERLVAERRRRLVGEARVVGWNALRFEVRNEGASFRSWGERDPFAALRVTDGLATVEGEGGGG
jgi:hypothetical protein